MMLALVMLITGVNYLDRANLAVAAPSIQRELGLNAAFMGVLLSSFGWAYTIFLPLSGAILDRVGPRVLYGIAVAGWSIATGLMGLARTALTMVGCRVVVGLFESPALPTNVRVVTAWHPANERALAIGLYTAMQYFALGLLTPVLAWMLTEFGWHSIFYATGGIGLLVAVIWYTSYRDPRLSAANQAELDYIRAGGGLSDRISDDATEPGAKAQPQVRASIRKLLAHRQVWGMFIGQFSVQTTMFFFLTWFPSYLITGRGLTVLQGGLYAAIPFLVAILGTILAGQLSDWMVGNGWPKAKARKVPIVAGLALSSIIVGANYTNSINGIITFMAIASFGQAMASTVTGALLSDVAPKTMVGLLGGMLYFVANIGGTLAPIVIGLIVNSTGGFNLALAYVSVVALMGVLSYIFLLGKVYRIEIDT
jgi:ACS family D-galactonate transporter-like MFS transporter